MKRSYLPIISTSIITASLAILPLTIPVKAQTNTYETSNTTRSQDVENYREDRGFSWGWLGLLGLAGLAGLNRPREEVTYTGSNNLNKPATTEKIVAYTEPNELNSDVTTKNAVRYRDPSGISLPDMNGKSDRY